MHRARQPSHDDHRQNIRLSVTAGSVRGLQPVLPFIIGIEYVAAIADCNQALASARYIQQQT